MTRLYSPSNHPYSTKLPRIGSARRKPTATGIFRRWREWDEGHHTVDGLKFNNDCVIQAFCNAVPGSDYETVAHHACAIRTWHPYLGGNMTTFFAGQGKRLVEIKADQIDDAVVTHGTVVCRGERGTGHAWVIRDGRPVNDLGFHTSSKNRRFWVVEDA